MKFCCWLVGIIGLLVGCHSSTTSVASNASSQVSAAVYNTQLGLAYFQQGDRPRAKRKLLMALAQAPDSSLVNAAVAYYMEKTGEFKLAQDYYLKAIKLAPTSGAPLNNYGAFLCRRGQYRQADIYFMKAVHDLQYEHTAAAYENAGLCAMMVPDEKKAQRDFVQALKHDPKRQQARLELARIQKKVNRRGIK